MRGAFVRTEHARSGESRERCIADDVELRETREHEDQDGQALLMGQVSDQTSEQLVTLLNAQERDEWMRITAKVGLRL